MVPQTIGSLPRTQCVISSVEGKPADKDTPAPSRKHTLRRPYSRLSTVPSISLAPFSVMRSCLPAALLIAAVRWSDRYSPWHLHRVQNHPAPAWGVWPLWASHDTAHQDSSADSVFRQAAVTDARSAHAPIVATVWEAIHPSCTASPHRSTYRAPKSTSTR